MYRGFKFDLAERKAADLFEVLLFAAYEEREQEEMLAWEMTTFLPPVEALYEVKEQDLDKYKSLKRKRVDPDLEDEGNTLPAKRTKQESSSVIHPDLDVQTLCFVSPAMQGPALTETEDSQRLPGGAVILGSSAPTEPFADIGVESISQPQEGLHPERRSSSGGHRSRRRRRD
ncbi:hypothetical protein Hypma_001323 [Hypsizygus marmoreus]|uniref:Uncharacterized protein n=1 Tax=Hypsizygus marmoreus TaxID=39966 RepID=A0A369K913_HYPMA|nr:hypothetical protein Hypma_001323 [Hypsizygus marmoreus]